MFLSNFTRSQLPRAINAYAASSCAVRNLSSSNNKDYVEVRIPVPWGHIAGKWWGPQDKRPILGIHGILDNAGSFDKLAPLLPDNTGFLAIDIMGHGFSTHFTPGLFYYYYDGVFMVKRIMDYFKWQKVSIVGHSMGSILGFVYSALFPKEVDFLVTLDTLKPISLLPGQNLLMNKIVTSFLKSELITSQVEAPCYTLPQIVERMANGSNGSISKESAPYLLRRSIKESEKYPGKYQLTRDVRLKVSGMPGFIHDECLVFASKIKAPMMNIKGKDSPFVEDTKLYFQVLDVLKKSSKDMYRIEVDGHHHLHLENADTIYEEVNKFIHKHDIEDRSVGGIKPEIIIDKIPNPF